MRVAINGFGRIGRCVLRSAAESGVLGKAFDCIAINCTHSPKEISYYFTHDSIYGQFEGEVSYSENTLIINGFEIRLVADRDPKNLPWKSLGIDCVIEATGSFTDRAGASLHLTAGAKKVLITAPAKNPDVTIAPGVNDDVYDPSTHSIISLASCTTNCLAPVAKVLEDNFGITSGFMTAVHAYTGDQTLTDDYHKKDLRRGRAAALSIVPTSTGAAKAIGDVLPSLKGKLDGIALRVPTPTGSMNSLVCTLTKEAGAEEVNSAMKKASEGKLKGILQYSEDELVSSDIIKNPHSSIFDSKLTKCIERTCSTYAWYDNEWGYSSRVVDAICKTLNKA
ncbi:MAG: type I glyceraldehyde-3-phosphate dehydrogenase [Candidatus Anstonellales archaeon]